MERFHKMNSGPSKSVKKKTKRKPIRDYCDRTQIPFLVLKDRDSCGRILLVNSAYKNPFLKILLDSYSEDDQQKSEKLPNDTKTRPV